MSFSLGARCGTALLVSALAVIWPNVASAQSAPTPPLSLRTANLSDANVFNAPTFVDSPKFVPGASLDHRMSVQTTAGVFHNGSDTEFYWILQWNAILDRYYGAAGKAKSNSMVALGVTAEGGIIGSSSQTFAGGPRVTYVLSKTKLGIYGDVLFGGLHFDGGTDFLIVPAAGVILPISKKIGIVGEIGWPIDYFDGGHETSTRYMGGIIVPIGKN